MSCSTCESHRTPAPAPPVRLRDLPEDVLLTICDFIHPASLHVLSVTSPFWSHFCLTKVWPRRIATTLGVRALHVDTSKLPATQTASLRHLPQYAPSSQTWHRLLQTFLAHPSTRTLAVCVHLSAGDSVTSLALQYAVTRQDIFRANSLFSEHHLASRTHLYIPLLTEASVLHFTGTPTRSHTPFLIKDTLLSNKYFLVVKFRPSSDPKPELGTAHSKRESYVRQLVVKLIAKGLSVDEDEVRFYLDDNNFDVARAYKQLLSDHNCYP